MARRNKASPIDALLALPHVHARGGKAYVRVTYRAEGGKYRSREKQVATVDEAIAALAELRRMTGAVAEDDTSRERMTFPELLAEYQIAYPKTPRWYLDPLRDYFGNRPIRGLTYADCERYRQARAAVESIRGGPRKPATIHRELEVLRAVLIYATRHGWIPRNPFAAGPPLIRKSQEATRARVPTPEEEARLLAVCVPPREHLRGLILAARDTGLRRSALLELTWGAIDWQVRTLCVPPARSQQKQRPGVIGLTARLYDELRRMWDAAAAPDLGAKIFGNLAGFKRSWRTACRLAGIKGLRFHDLRHGYATDLLEAGVNERLAMKLLGHSNEEIHAIYTNLDSRLALTVAAALDDLHVARAKRDEADGAED